MSQIRLIELFAGYGSQAMALKRCGISFEHHRVVEVVPWVVDTYNKIHHTDFKPIDIKEMKGSDLGIHHTDKYTYLMFYSFPCTDLSTCGEMKGMSRGSGTRSGLLWEVERLLKECDELPQILMMENVTQVHGCRNIDDFNEWIAFLNSLGYSSKWQDLNAADYGVPQIRNRTFMVSFLDRKRDFVFPQKIRLEKTLRDLLEDDVGEKYFLS